MMAGNFNVMCGVISSDGQINQDMGFKFFTWVATSNTKIENQVTLAERVQSMYPDMREPYQIVCIDDANERVVLQANDFKETIAAFICLQPKNDRPVRICIQPLSFFKPGNCNGQVHLDVTCSHCKREPIEGFRYDCLQCPNYILCGRCDSNGIHPEHNFIRTCYPPSGCFEKGSSYPSLQRTVQNLGDRLEGQMNTLELSVGKAIYNLTEFLRARDGKEEAQVDKITEKLEQL